jgi:NAD(P)-dependent dehydrogenase (short-subunit alcohol dehydrogenase family)
MKDEIRGRVILITGATSGIGRATALQFAQKGTTIVSIGRDQKRLEELNREIINRESRSITIQADVTAENAYKHIIKETIEEAGGLDVLINAAGIIANGTIENTTIEAWDKMMNINLRSIFLLMQEAVPHLAKRRGNIVNVSSVTGLRAFPGVLAYCVSKAGLDQLTRCAALELASKGIRVNAVNPGVVVTNLHREGGMDEEAYTKFVEHSKQTHPLGRTGRPEEIADLIYFLASEQASWITGVTYSIDGGRSQTCAR